MFSAKDDKKVTLLIFYCSSVSKSLAWTPPLHKGGGVDFFKIDGNGGGGV